MLIKSKIELDSQKKSYPPLKHGDYELFISEAKAGERPKYMQPDKIEKIVDFTLEVQGTRDGEKPVDEEGNDATGRKVFFTLRPESLGYTREGIPAKGRSFLAYALEIEDVEGEFDVPDNWSELTGKIIYAEIMPYKTQKGNRSCKIARFILPPKK